MKRSQPASGYGKWLWSAAFLWLLRGWCVSRWGGDGGHMWVEWYLRQTASPQHVQLGDLRVWHQDKGLHGEVSFFSGEHGNLHLWYHIWASNKTFWGNLDTWIRQSRDNWHPMCWQRSCWCWQQANSWETVCLWHGPAWLCAPNLRKGRKMSGGKNLNEFDTLKRHTPCCRELPIKSCNSDTQLTRTNWQWPNPWPKPHLHWWQQSTSMKAKKLMISKMLEDVFS